MKTGIYIHWPFCASKCPYCDFNTYVRKNIDENRWLAAYLTALDYYAYLLPDRQIDTVFFGGGTPSLMRPDMVGAILDRIQRNFKIANNLEVTLEANPTSAEADKFKDFRAAGVNRVSIGLQSFDDKALEFLGRRHSADEGVRAIQMAQRIFERTSFDLIYARPEQTVTDWEAELDQAIALQAGHISLYQLTIEEATPFYVRYQKGQFEMPEEERAAEFYALTQEKLGAAGLHAYEVSNHAAAGQEARHNLIYWNYDDYVGIGPGAHGRLSLNGAKNATFDIKSPDKWLERVEAQGCGSEPFEALDARDQFTESFMMGMRLNAGMELPAGWREYLDEGKLQTAIDEGWVSIKTMSSPEFSTCPAKPKGRSGEKIVRGSGDVGQKTPLQFASANSGGDGFCLQASQEGMLRLNGLLRFLLK